MQDGQQQKGLAGPRDAGPPAGAAPGVARWAARVVWSVWALTLLAGLGFVARYGSPGFPQMDDWEFTDLMIGEQPITFAWLWAQHAEHRIPLAKLLWLGVIRLTDYQYGVGNLLQVLALGAVAFAAIRVAKYVRGRTSYADVFFPLALLNLGQCFDFMAWWQVNHLLAPLLASVLLLMIVLQGGPLKFGPALAFAACLLVLPLCGPGGLAYVFALAPWLGNWADGYGRRSKAGRKPRGLWVAALVLGAVVLVGLYFVGYDEREQLSSHDPGLPQWVKAFLQLWSLGLGPETRPLWWVWGTGVLGLGLLSTAVLAAVAYRRPPERCRAGALLLFLAANGGFVLALAKARASLGEENLFDGHYLLYVVPGLCAVYFTAALYFRTPWGRLVQAALALALCLQGVLSARSALEFAEPRKARQDAFRHDLENGAPVLYLAEQYKDCVMQSESPDAERVGGRMDRVRQGGLGLLRRMQPLPALREVRIPVEPVAAQAMRWENGTGSVQGGESCVVFALAKPLPVHAIRLRFSYRDTDGPLSLEVFWQDLGRSATEGRQSFRKGLDVNDASDKKVIVAVNGTVDQFRIVPDANPCTWHLAEITALVPADQTGADQPASPSPLAGGLESADPVNLKGWASLRDRPLATARVAIFEGDDLLATVPADRPRRAVGEGGGEGHGFRFPIPCPLRDGSVHTFHVKFAGTGVELPGSPKQVCLKAP